MNTSLKMARTTLVLILISCLGTGLSLVKEMLVAARFGVSGEMDAYYSALTIPSFINNIVITTFVAVFIPVFARCFGDRQESDRIASLSLNYLFVGLTVLSAVIAALAPWIISWGFHGLSAETAARSTFLLRSVTVIMLLTGISGALSGLLNTSGIFAFPAISGMFITFSTLALLVFIDSANVTILVYGLIIGGCLQAASLFILALRSGFRYRLDFSFDHPALKEMIALGTVLFFAVIGSQANIVIDRVMASYLDPGSISAMGYADKLIQVPLLIFSGSIATALFPFLSHQVAGQQHAELSRTVTRTIRLTTVVFIPLTVLLLIFGKPVISLLFERGRFGREATELTGAVFSAYALQFVFYPVVLVMNRVFLALQQAAIFARITIFLLVMNVICNFMFMRLVNPPVAGIALSTSVVFCLSAFLCAYFARKTPVSIDWTYVLGGTGKVTVLSLVMGAVSAVVFSLLTGSFHSGISLGKAAALILALGLGVSSFLLLARLFRLEEISTLMKVFIPVRHA